ncbi:MAG: PspC domain-containing protein [Clostridiales bacterium]
MKKLYRSSKNKMFMGVCGGIGEALNIDPTIIRVAWLLISCLLTFLVGGLIIYIVCGIIIPQDPGYTDIS